MNIYFLINNNYFNDFLERYCNDNNYEYVIYNDFFDKNFINSIIKYKGDIVIGVEYEVSSNNIDIVEKFIIQSKKNNKNIYYSPKPNKSFTTLSYALFYLVDADALPHYFVEKLYTEAFLTLSSRNNIHTLLRKNLDLSTPKLLTNLSDNWQEWDANRDVLNYDLVKRVDNYYRAPKTIHVAVGNQCNLTCVMCPHHSKEIKKTHTTNYFDTKEIMSIESFDKIAKYAAKNQSAIQFGQIEEPFLNTNLVEFIKIAKGYNVPSVHLTTNGTLLNAKNASELASSGVDSVMFSIDAATKELYKKIRGGDLEKLEKKITHFISLAKNKNITLGVSFILQDTSPLEKEAFIKKWKNYGVKSVTCYNLSEYDEKGDVSRKDDMYARGERYPCGSPWSMSAVMPNGDVTMCCKTLGEVGWENVKSLGNLSKNSFDEIWMGEQYSTVRKELLQNKFTDFKTCENCEIWSATNYFKREDDEYEITYNETTEVFTFK
ncbi:MAG: radical SAM protein [Sulfurimonas denitrificans]|nr:radical SAM protein [Sulfurimonas denitrificans]